VPGVSPLTANGTFTLGIGSIVHVAGGEVLVIAANRRS
jgi:hypothetical protein